MTEKKTGYPSIDKPWLKYYRQEVINTPLPQMTMYEYAWKNNKDHLDDIAMIYFGKKITYDALFRNVMRLATAFCNMGIGAGDIVTIMSMHTPETIYAIYGLNYIGAVANMVYMTLSGKEILDTLNNTKSKCFMVLDVSLGNVDKVREKISIPVIVFSVEDSMPLSVKLGYKIKLRKEGKVEPNTEHYTKYQDFIREKKGNIDLTPTTDHNAMAVIVYTSGTTGEPKGVCLSNDAMNGLAFQDINGLIDFQRGKDCLFIIPPFFGFGVTILHAIINGGVVLDLQIVLESNEICKRFFALKPYCFMAGPALVDIISAHKPVRLDKVKYFIGGGGSISEQQENEINNLLKKCKSVARYSNGYGMTEAGSVVCYNINDIYKQGSVGIPFFAMNVKVLNENNEELKYGQVGELLFEGPNVMMGYFNNDLANEEAFVSDSDGRRWLRSGDLGYVDEDGFVFLKGRKKRIYITKGTDGTAYKLFPQRIEELVETDADVSKCGVIVCEDKDRMNVAKAFVSLKSIRSARIENDVYERIIALLQRELPEHMRPIEVRVISEMPITANGKIDYRELEKIEN